MSDHTPHERASRAGGAKSYLRLLIALALSLVVMYFLTFALINVVGDLYLNISNLYMALMMVFPMGIIKIAIMWRMFPNKPLNIGLIVAFALLTVGALFMGRAATFVGNQQFLDSMIPHHSRAILLCEQSNITDPEIKDLCGEIVESQQQEIDQMKDILQRLGN